MPRCFASDTETVVRPAEQTRYHNRHLYRPLGEQGLRTMPAAGRRGPGQPDAGQDRDAARAGANAAVGQPGEPGEWSEGGRTAESVGAGADR